MAKLTSELYKGAYNGATAYTPGDTVTVSGSSYVCIANTTGNTPPNASYWALLAQAGTDGIDGADGEVSLNGIQTLTNKTLTGPIITDKSSTGTDSGVEILENKTLPSPVLTTPQINDTSSDHQYIVAVNELSADRTVTLPLLTADDQFVFRDHADIKLKAPRGFLINGKIVPSVSSDNLIVSIKTLAGTDPSATDPVYCRIGDTVRSITSALSVTVNAGANTMNLGSAELATKEVDLFPVLGYNATDGVVIGFSRRPGYCEYSQWSTTATNENYLAVSNRSNAVSGDDYEVIGRFAATLSAGPGYTWTVPTFTNINLIQRPIYSTRALNFTPTPTASGSAYTNAPTITLATYTILDAGQETTILIKIKWQYHATSGGTGGSVFTLPFTPSPTNQVGMAANMSNPFALNATFATTSVSVYKYDGTTPIVNSHLCELVGLVTI